MTTLYSYSFLYNRLSFFLILIYQNSYIFLVEIYQVFLLTPSFTSTEGIKPPRNLKITVITDTQVTFTWSPPIGVDIDETKITIVNNNNKKKLNYPAAPGTDSEYTVTGLSPGTPYIIQIQSVKGNSISTITETGLRTGEDFAHSLLINHLKENSSFTSLRAADVFTSKHESKLIFF